AHTSPAQIDMTDPSLDAAPAAPSALFETERWDDGPLPEMTWAFPVPSGTEVELRLFFAELYSGVNIPGERVFDVEVEGSVPPAFNDVDQIAVAGPKGAFMRSVSLTVTDGTLDFLLVHGVENTALKGIEIIIPEDATPSLVFDPTTAS